MLPYLSGAGFYYSLLFLNSALLYLLKFRFRKKQSLVMAVSFICFLIGIIFSGLNLIFCFALPVLVNALANVKGQIKFCLKIWRFYLCYICFFIPHSTDAIAKGIIDPCQLFNVTTAIVFRLAILSWNFLEYS
jgi:hypothetical protein